MKEILKQLLLSKRVWVVAAAAGILVFKHYTGVDPCVEAGALSDANVLSVAGILTILTKIVDSSKG